MQFFVLSSAIRFPEATPTRYAVALHGDLGVERLITAYASGYFPMYLEGEPLQWHSPCHRFVVYPAALKVPRSLERVIKAGVFSVSFDREFRQVIENCRHVVRPCQDDTWITRDMVEAYCGLHDAGFAHSVEVWRDSALVGGLYGVALGRCFSGESMFHRVTDASKVGVVTLVRRLAREGFGLIDCQQKSPLFERLGGVTISRSTYLRELRRCGVPAELSQVLQLPHGPWGQTEERPVSA